MSKEMEYHKKLQRFKNINIPVDQGWPTRGTCATSGMRTLSKWHTQNHYILYK